MPIGPITITEDNGYITRLDFSAEGMDEPSPLIKKAFNQLDEYFAGQRQIFELPLAPAGTAFQCRVWKILQEIPFGRTICYKTLAELCGNAKAVRAVGGANHRNPLPIFIPCHRVIGSNGKLVGYGGGLSIKTFLLKLEQDI